MNNKEEEYFIFHKTLAAWLAVDVGCDPKPLNVSGSHSVRFSGADLQGALLWLILISQVWSSSPRGEPRMALLYCTGTKEAVWAVESLYSKQRHQQSNQASYVPADWEWATGERERKIKSLEPGME